jgi:hypothetical protein
MANPLSSKAQVKVPPGSFSITTNHPDDDGCYIPGISHE